MVVPMPVKTQWFIVCVVVCIGMGYLYSLSASDRNVPTGFLSGVFQNDIPKSAGGVIETNKNIQDSRIEIVRNVCRQTSILATSKYKVLSKPKYYYSPSYNFTFCKVPKCGSTFWTQVIEILNKGIEQADEVFTRKRVDVHRFFAKRNNISANGNPQRAPVIFVSRDPYSRLFSAYIDKIYMPQMLHIQGNICPGNISFQMFLESVASRAFAGKKLDGHWAPISSLCRPCEYNEMFLIKQETFSYDVEYALKVFHVEKNKIELIIDKMYDQRPQSTIPGIVETVYHNTAHNVTINCYGYHDIAERIWRSFQIQGFLKDTVPFPKHARINELRNASYLSEHVMGAIETHPISRDNQKTQRRAALVDAYRKVSKETIKKIQQVYKNDFAMFNYSEEPPLFET